MDLQAIFSNRPMTVQTGVEKGNQITPAQAQQSFSNLLKAAINEVNEVQNQSDNLTKKLAMGEPVELHQVMIAAEKASITLQTTMEIRNKVVEAYQEIMRMQV